MAALADLTIPELRARSRALKATIKRRNDAIWRARADMSEAHLRLQGVQREIERREKIKVSNSRRG